MNWSEEFWIKLYRRASPSFLSMTWQARGLFRLVITEVDPLGRLELGKMGLKAVAVSVRAPWVEIQPYVQECIDDGCLALSEDGRTLSCPNFVEAQEAAQSGKARSASYRAKHKARDASATNRCADETECGDSATGGNATQRDETARNDQSRSEQTRSDPTPTELVGTAEAAPPSRVGQAEPEPVAVLSQTEPSRPKRQRKPQQQTIPTSLPASVGWGIWRNLYSSSRRGYGAYIDAPEDGPEMARIVRKATEHALAHARANGPCSEPIQPIVEAALDHWFKSYLRDAGGDKEWIVEQRHPLRYVLKGVTKYGLPWSLPSPAEPRDAQAEAMRARAALMNSLGGAHG